MNTNTHSTNARPCDYCGSTDDSRNIDEVEFTWGYFTLATVWLCDDDECLEGFDCPQPTRAMWREAWAG